MTAHLERNLGALATQDAALAERLRSIPPDPALLVKQTKAGVPTIRAPAQDGSERFLHSEFDPLLESRQFCAGRIKGDPDTFVLAGFGMGYHAIEVAKKIPAQTWLVLIEAKEAIFRAALEHVDLTGLLSRPRTRVFVGSDWVSFLDFLRDFFNYSECLEAKLITTPGCARLAPQFYARVAVEMEAAVNRRRVEVNTLVRLATTLDANSIHNVAFLPESYRIRDLEGAFEGVPGIVVGAGPSLNDSLAELKRAAGRCVVVTVGKSLKFLTQNGIEAHFTASLDMTAASGVLFEGEDVPESAWLVYDPDSYPGVQRGYRGPKIAYACPSPISRWADSFLGPIGEIEKGLSVAHTAFYLARALGVDPIILVGVDLALPGERTHAEGVTMTWGGSVGDQKNLRFADVPCVKGGKVRSLKSFQSFVTAFEVEIARTKATVVNTSSFGALIRGTENLSLAEAMDRWCGIEHDVRGVLEKRRGKLPPFDADLFSRKAGELVSGLEKVREMCAGGQRALGRARRLNLDNRLEADEFRKLGARMEKTAAEILQDSWAKMLGRLVSPKALEIRKLAKEAAAAEPRKRVEINLRRLELLFEAYRDSAGYFLDRFGEMRDELTKRLKTGGPNEG